LKERKNIFAIKLKFAISIFGSFDIAMVQVLHFVFQRRSTTNLIISCYMQ